VASLGVPLGINVADLYAASQKNPPKNESLQQGNAASADWDQLNASQSKLSEQIKLTNASQSKLQEQLTIEGTKQGKFKGEAIWKKSIATQHKEWQTTELNLANQIKALHTDDVQLSAKFNVAKATFLKSAQPAFIKGGQASQQKYDAWQANELKLSDQIKQLEANELKISQQLKQLYPAASE
jgi:hypothetical protein